MAAFDDTELQQFRADVTSAHNKYRARHLANDLTPSDDLHRGAQAWADTVADAGFLQYSETAGLGENIMFMDVNGQRPCGHQIIGDWYREADLYRFDQPRWRKDTIHFTQLVWRSTTEVGVGVARVVGQDRWVVVAHYRPPGNTNMPGDFQRNVLSPVSP